MLWRTPVRHYYGMWPKYFLQQIPPGSKSARSPFPPGRRICQQFDKDSAYDGTRLKATLFAVLCPVPIAKRYARRRFFGEFESRGGQRVEIIRVVSQRSRPQNPIQFGVCRTVVQRQTEGILLRLVVGDFFARDVRRE